MIDFKLAFASSLLMLSLGCSSSPKTTPAASPSPAPSAVPSPSASASPPPGAAKTQAKPSSAKSASGLELKCEKGDDKRVVTVVPKGDGCELYYSKFGDSGVIASSAIQVEHCEKVQGNVRKNLEASGFSCK